MPTDRRGLYICYFGLREPLVQTQVLPYLRELMRDGPMSLLTFEPELKTRWTQNDIVETRERLREEGIDWHLLPYHRRPVLPATLWDVAAGTWRVVRIVRHDHIQILHGRSHVGAAIAVLARAFTGARVIFDVRGFLADEYVDAGRWKSGGFLFRLVKAAEGRLCRSADGLVVLTERARDTLVSTGAPRGQPLEVIPTCVDLRRFEALSPSDRETVRARLGVSDRTVFIHAGTVGGAYLIDGTARVLAVARRLDPRVYALVLSRDAAPLVTALEAAGFTSRDYRAVQVSPDEVRAYMHAADVGLMLIRPSFARRAMSPTKFAEYLAAGLPIVTSAGIGDLDEQVSPHRVGVALSQFDEDAMIAAVHDIETLRRDPQLASRCRHLARTTYDLERVGGARYRRLYEAVVARSPPRRVRVLALASYPLETASSRYRVVQVITPLAARGIDVDFSPFLDGSLVDALYEPSRFLRRLPRVVQRVVRRLGTALRAVRADVVFVQREAMLFGPPVIEWIATRLLRRPLVLDLDDPTYLAYPSPVYGHLATALKWPGKTHTLMRWSRVVTCGSANIATYAQARGADVIVVPAAVDPLLFRPGLRCGDGLLTIGWIGTHGTYPFLESLFPVFERLARLFRFRLLVVGSSRSGVTIPGVEVDLRPWALSREADDFRSLDIGVYPLPDSEWTAGKSGLKAIHYMMSGVAAVISPVGVCATLGVPGETHLSAATADDWLDALGRLAGDRELRARIGGAGRRFAERLHTVDRQADQLASVIRAIAS
jgi:glycosyltransferase involved in cell wall biosynthesis